MSTLQSVRQLLAYVEPELFLTVLRDAFSINLRFKIKPGSRKKRKEILKALLDEDPEQQFELEAAMARVLLLCNTLGQQAVTTVARGPLQGHVFKDRYHRTLWLYVKEPQLFDEVLECYRSHCRDNPETRRCCGFQLPTGLAADSSELVKKRCRAILSQQLGVKVYLQKENIPADSSNHGWAASLSFDDQHVYLMYEKLSGMLYLTSTDFFPAEQIAFILAENILGYVPKRELNRIGYDYQVLASEGYQMAAPVSPAISQVKVTLLSCQHKGNTLTVESPLHSGMDIHAAATELSGSQLFFLPRRPLTQAAVTMKIQGDCPTEPDREVVVYMSGRSGCSYCAENAADKWLCQQFLMVNGMIERLGYGQSVTGDCD